jgi:hypothetical protein
VAKYPQIHPVSLPCGIAKLYLRNYGPAFVQVSFEGTQAVGDENCGENKLDRGADGFFNMT